VSSLAAADFDSFFGELYRGQDGWPLEPFPWQRRLVRRILGEGGRSPGWPKVLALPTASGKTAAIDIAVFTLACQAEAAPGTRNAPRRIFFVVDRRVIVDEAFNRARALAEKLATAETGVIARVADRLRALASTGSEHPPLAAFELRGGTYRDDAWSLTPLQPTVVASTVDQVGSRLLHRGYGVSWKSWPIHAGLAAHDALVILDEAHCAQPFGDTMEAVARYRAWAQEPLPPPFVYVSMTATPRPGIAEDDVFSLYDEDRANPELGRRLQARKPAELLPALPGKTGSKRLVQALCEKAEAFAGSGARRIAVLVNRVETARRVHERLDGRLGDKVLMTGRMRPWDRDRLLERWRPSLTASSVRPMRDRPIFVAATQCLEVGANLDFDALVSECASLDALRQRFGRLNRLGSAESVLAAVAVAAEDVKSGQEDFVYGAALGATWRWLTANAAEEGGLQTFDFGIDSLDATWKAALQGEPKLLTGLSPPAPRAPVMLPSHLDLWVQTAPAPAPDPDPSIFLHGPDRGAPEVQVCWRLDLDLPQEDRPDWSDVLDRWANTVALVPPTSAECMPVPVHVLRRWLDGAPGPAEHLVDVEGSITRPTEEAESVEREPNGPRRTILRWLGPEESELIHPDDTPHPGATLVIPAALGGWADFGHIPVDESGHLSLDLGEAAHFERRRRAVLRLHPAVLKEWPASPSRDRLLEITGWSETTAEEQDIESALLDPLRELALGVQAPAELHKVLEKLTGYGFDPVPHPSGQGWVLRGRWRPPADAAVRTAALAQAAETFSTDDDSASATTNVPLADHCSGVADLAGRFAEVSGLPPYLVEDLRLAGRLHDLGKADPRFQAWLHGGSALASQFAPLLAKSERLPEDRRERELARRRARYPRGGRHELLSLRLVESGRGLLQSAADPELVLHLIASHHGRCRPFAPIIADDKPVHVQLEQEGVRLEASSATCLEKLDSGIAECFWHLIRRYGWWGLSLLEAIIRLADHRRSEAEEFRASQASNARRKTA